MDYAEKLATVAAEISYLSGNIGASDAICERIDHACRYIIIIEAYKTKSFNLHFIKFLDKFIKVIRYVCRQLLV